MPRPDQAIDAINEKVGVTTSLLAVPLVAVVVYEVIMRYCFDAPTSWGFELTTFLYGAHFILGFGYCHKHDGHVAIDVFEARLPQRPRTLLRIVTNLVIFLPVVGLFSVWSIKYAITSWSLWERASSSWGPPIYPWKTLMAIGFVLLLLQGVAKLIQDFRSLRGDDR
jgi:TRAP-type mannitol/chloroaromatic compound transport system permease small subunit